MTRVQSQRTRQALLVVGQAPEENPPPELLELYTQDGVAVDVGKDRTRARWRGVWVNTPTEPYEQNDFVLDEDNLWILSDATLLGDNDQPTSSTTGAWTLMTVGGGMKWGGVFDPDVDYGNQDLVSNDGALYIAQGAITSGGAAPGTPLADLATTTVKAGDAMFGGHSQPARILIKGQILDPVPAQLGGETNIGEPIGGKFFKVGAISGDVVTLEWEGGDLTLFDGGGGDSLFPTSPNPPGGSVSSSNSPLTFVVPATTPNTTVPSYIAIEADSGVTSLLWSGEDDAGAWELVFEAPPSGGFEGDWNDSTDYLNKSIVRHEGAVWMADGDIEAGLEPEEATGVATRTSYAYAFGNYNFPDTPILELNVPFTDLASAPTGGMWAGGTKVVCFDAPPGTAITVTCSGGGGGQGVVAFRDTGSSGSGNSEINNHSFESPKMFTMPSEGKVTLEVYGAPSSILVEADGVEAASKWELLVPGGSELPSGGDAGMFLAKVSSTDGDVDWVIPASGMTFEGDWAALDYFAGTVVTLGGHVYLAVTDAQETDVPGTVPTDNLLSTTKGLPVRESDRLKSTSYVFRTIDASCSVTDVGSPVPAGNKGKGVMIDRTGTSGQTVTIKNDHPTSNLYVSAWTPDNFSSGVADTTKNLAPGASGDIVLSSGSWDVVMVCAFVTAGALGTFEIRSTNITGLNAPPTPSPWTMLA